MCNKLQQVEALPEEAGESDVQVAGGATTMMWIVMKPKPGYTDSDRYRDLIDEVIEPELRRVEGWSILHCWWSGTGSGGAC